MSKIGHNNDLSIKDVDDLLDLFCQLKNASARKLPDLDENKWNEAYEEAKLQLNEQLEKRSKMILTGPSPKKKSLLDTFISELRADQDPSYAKKLKQLEQIELSGISDQHLPCPSMPGIRTGPDNKLDQQVKKRVEALAKRIYYSKDEDYAKALDARKKEISDLLKSIDHLLIHIRKQLLCFPRVKQSILAVDFREHFRDIAIRNVNQRWFMSSIDDAVDVLESVKFALDRQKQAKSVKPKTKGWKPPKGYISSSTIVNDNQYKVPRTTLQAWAERDGVIPKKDPQTGENYYRLTWVKKRVKNYKRRP